MNEGDLRLTASYGAEEFQGSFLGIETALFHWVALALLAALGLFVGLFFGLGLEFLAAMRWALLPPGVVVGYLRLFHQGKSYPHHLFDLLESALTGGHAKPPRDFAPNPFHDV